jgi:hypothetical protein
LRPKEIQDRIRAGETAEEIADAAGVPIERVRRFEGPVLAERAYRAEEAQRATLRQPGDSGPGRSLGDVVTERLRMFGIDPADAEWDSRKRSDGGWQVRLAFSSGSRPHLAEWVYDPHRKHVAPADDTAARLCLPEADLPEAAPEFRAAARATVTPIGSRLGPPAQPEQDPGQPAEQVRVPAPARARAPEPARARAPEPARPRAAEPARPRAAEAEADTGQPAPAPRERPARKAAGGRSRRSSVPSWDEIMFGNSRPSD